MMPVMYLRAKTHTNPRPNATPIPQTRITHLQNQRMSGSGSTREKTRLPCSVQVSEISTPHLPRSIHLIKQVIGSATEHTLLIELAT
jgi:hypothetical protein